MRVSCSCCTDDEKVLSTDAFGAFPLSRMTDEKPPTGDHGVADHEEESESSHELCEMIRGEKEIVSRLLFRSFFFLFYPWGEGRGICLVVDDGLTPAMNQAAITAFSSSPRTCDRGSHFVFSPLLSTMQIAHVVTAACLSGSTAFSPVFVCFTKTVP